ncbi:hypothetical protein Val02_52750 [Virgisporangium aliadipatigenens]|uniref:DUF4194 domain-containing protein n=1 Tax=Virgisporangium aliadipatigenens TaxID=741659 RepID=A0A8J3YMR2_9ACTN|nr:DUF4194 domain-containing protein [Virgisporangium aliadipatigenens]GIJ48389.1 hypothetical protein Val02_52750 [Virgisporangium aliadipatigenens]
MSELFEEPTPTGPALDPAALFADSDGSAVGGVLAEAPRPRFDGDTGRLPAEVCWTLQELVAAPHISDKSRRHWAVVTQYEEILRSRLSELGLILEINREHGHAFTRQADDPGPMSRTVLRARTLSLAASALTLYLLQQYLLAPDDPVVDTADMLDHMLAYKRPGDTDEAAFHKKVLTAIRSLDDAAIIKPIKGTSRYVVYGVITSLLTPEQVDSLRERYLAVARGEAPESGVDDDE